MTSARPASGPPAATLPSRRLGFAFALWAGAVICLVFMFGASSVLPLSFFPALAWATGMFACIVLLGPRLQTVALVASFTVLFNASYVPIFGYFAGLGDAGMVFYKLGLGLRSAWYAGALLALGALFVFVRKARERLPSGLVLWTILSLGMLFLAFAISSAPLEGRATYLLNSFVPIVMTVFFLGAVCALEPMDYRDGMYLTWMICGLALVSAAYFVVLPFFYDAFRPDLASYLRARPGEYIAYGDYDPSWGTHIGPFYFNRFVGTFSDAIVAGYFWAGLTFTMFISRKWLPFFIAGFLLMLSFSKGAWMFFFQATALYWLGRKSLWLVLPAACAMVAFQLGLSGFVDASNKMHFRGLVGGIESVLHGGIKPLIMGFGLGAGGNLGRASVAGGALGSDWLGSGSESGVGVLVYQLGLGGALVIALLIFRGFFASAAAAAKRAADPGTRNAIVAVVALYFSLLVNTPLQENCVNASVLSSILLSGILIRSLMAKRAPAPAVSREPRFSAAAGRNLP